VTRHGDVVASVRGEMAPEGEREETTAIGLTRILPGQKIKKIHAVYSVATIDDEDLK
jgi:hypothetical protein